MRIHRHIVQILFCAAIALPLLAHASDEEDSKKKLPLPRFVSLRSSETNVRAGPGTRYSINYVYKKAGLPVEIVQEFDAWREIRDSDGSQGWVYKNMLSGRRTIVVTRTTRALRRAPQADSGVLLKAEPGVVGQLLACEKAWCRIQIDSRKGWMKKGEFWGAYTKEEFKE
jgi:SH3-like domain-containing protein